MSDRSKNILATAALIGVAALASSKTLTAPAAPSRSAQVAQLQPAAAAPAVAASVDR